MRRDFENSILKIRLGTQPETAGVRMGLGAAGHQQAAEVYTEALLATTVKQVREVQSTSIGK